MITRILFVFTIILTLMSCASNTLTHDRGVMIGGIRWATRNVDAPKTFVASRYEVGMMYQWDSKIGWNVSDPILSTQGDTVWRTLNNKTSEWLPENDPCPTGWRMPTRTEAEILINTPSVWKNEGRLFAGKLFMPTAGCRNVGRLTSPSTDGYYWTATREDKATGVYELRFEKIAYKNESARIGYGYYRGNALNIRCVKGDR